MELEGKTLFVTGASRGIGLATARAFAQAGARVVLGARTEVDLLLETRAIEAQGGSAFATLLDVTSDASVARAVAVIPGHSSGGAGPRVALDGPTLETPEQIARTVVLAARRPRRERVSGMPNRVFLRVARLWPWIAEGTMLSFAKRSLSAAAFAKRATLAGSLPSSVETRGETRVARRSPAGS